MIKFIVVVAAIGAIFLFLIAVIAPATPEGSFLNEFGEDMRDAMGSWFGNPVTVE